MSSELNEIRAHIDAVLDVTFTDAARGKIRSHLVWELREMINHISPADMTDAELAAAIAVFYPVHARVLAPVPTRPPERLRLVSDLPTTG
jgi:hypothetical protein